MVFRARLRLDLVPAVEWVTVKAAEWARATGAALDLATVTTWEAATRGSVEEVEVRQPSLTRSLCL